MRISNDWEHIDHGRKQTFQIDRSRISFEDLGPVGHLALVEEAAEAQRLWREGQPEEARIHLNRLPIHNAYLPDSRQYQAILDAITEARNSLDRHGPAYGEAAFRELLQLLARVPDPPIEEMVDEGLDAWSHDVRRDISWKQVTQIDGRPTVIIETWDRLSHRWPKKHALLLNDGRLLSLDSEFGEFGERQEEFDQLISSLAFASAPAESPPLRSR